MSKTFPIELSEDLHKRLKHAAVDAGLTLHDWILRALSEKVRSGDRERATIKTGANHDRNHRAH